VNRGTGPDQQVGLAAVAEVGGRAGAVSDGVEIGNTEVPERCLGKESDAEGSVIGEAEDPDKVPCLAVGG